MRIAQLSDTHISHRGGATVDNFERLVELVNSFDLDFVVTSGDVSILDPDNAEDRLTAKRLHDAITAPHRVLPGNHDVGEPGRHPWKGLATTSERVSAFTGVFGTDHWVEILGDWAIIGLNSEVMGTGLPEEAAQWAWLETVPALVGDRHVIGFSHKPLWAPIDLGEHQVGLFDADRERLLTILAGVDLRAWCSGHLHYYGLAQGELSSGKKILTVSAPATGFVNEAATFFMPGLVQQGIVVYDLPEDGVVRAAFRSRNDLDEVDAEAIPAFKAAMGDLGITQL
ncbi:metallophosphoesterase [Raineyella sp. LH-20]|uniref:metallophosphoesterase family protein n=1 Tax=Raineyella sp. LH-20 TaxID=3081204 RepID=UPI002953F2D8|nr:metallophosphoesterase [Raineyella sp. LH-20]WOP19513.1 metallophosphoesterase [Raineyella sp. LH-20]